MLFIPCIDYRAYEDRVTLIRVNPNQGEPMNPNQGGTAQQRAGPSPAMVSARQPIRPAQSSGAVATGSASRLAIAGPSLSEKFLNSSIRNVPGSPATFPQLASTILCSSPWIRRRVAAGDEASVAWNKTTDGISRTRELPSGVLQYEDYITAARRTARLFIAHRK